MGADTLIIGAGVAGLSCARELAAGGRRVVVLERARGVGGRCATRRIQGQPVDHGVAFLHGSDPGFLAALRAVEGASPLPGWPLRVQGQGHPCQDTSFAPGASRLAFREGVSAFPKHLAREIDVRLLTPVGSLQPEDGVLRLAGGSGDRWEAREVVLALALEQSLALLEPLSAGEGDVREVAAACGLLRMVGSLSCLTVVAGYAGGEPEPGWDVLYPEESRILQLIVHDSAKRTHPGHLVLVAQARPCWSRLNQERPEVAWSGEIMDEVARLLGLWAADTSWRQPHRWRYARVDRGGELRQPLLLRLPGGATIGMTGEAFHPGGGVEAAWCAGSLLARRMLSEER